MKFSSRFVTASLILYSYKWHIHSDTRASCLTDAFWLEKIHMYRPAKEKKPGQHSE